MCRRGRSLISDQEALNAEQLLAVIGKFINEVLQTKGSAAAKIVSATPLLNGDLDIDSLDLAGLIVELASTTGKDPFEEGFVDFQTAGELSHLYLDS